MAVSVHKNRKCTKILGVKRCESPRRQVRARKRHGLEGLVNSEEEIRP